ncbi:fibronectin type III domain-containing protein, partial [Haloflavibacter putidus]
MPVDLVVNNITSATAEISWTPISDETEWEIIYGPVGFDPETEGTSVIDNDGSVGITLTGLNPATDYEVYIKAICSPTDESNLSGPIAFSTACDVISLPWIEDFAADSTPTCWEEGGDNAWDYSTAAGYAATDVLDHTPGGGTNYAWMDGSDNSDGEISTLTSPFIDVSSLTVPALEFYLFSNNTDDGAINIVDVEIYNGTAWNDVLNINTLQGDSWKQYVLDLSTYNITGPVRVRFTVTGSANGSAFYNDILIDDVTFIEMPDCVDPIANFTVLEDCINGPQFNIEVDITNMGGSDTLEISDNQGSPAQTISAAGTVTFGPFANNTLVEITIENPAEANCSLISQELTQEYCATNYVDCTVGPINTTICYENGQTTELVYTSSDGTPLNLVVNAGGVEDNWDEFIVLDTDGTELYNGYGNGGDLSGLNFQSTGDTITIQIVADGSNGCASSSDYSPLDVTVSCATCINPAAFYTVQSDCDSGTDQFFIDVEITDLGSATSLTIEDNQGSATQTANATGVFTFGPYPNTTNLIFQIENNDDSNCIITSGTLTQEFCPPDNTNCDAAETAIVNAGNLCEQTTPGTLQGANASSVSVSCGGAVAQDVWFEFTATSTEHMTALLEGDGNSSSDLYHAIYEGDSCGNLTELFCSEEFENGGNSPNIVAQNLTIGETYKVRVFSTSVSDEEFNLCITTPDFGENTACSDVAPFCAPTDTSGNPEPLIFPNGYFYLNESVAETGPDYDCLGTQPNPAWYYLQVADSGDLEFEIIQSTAFDANGDQIGDGLDVDFIAYGPFDTVEDNCNALTLANVVDCSYSADSVETMTINGAQEGDVYIVLITNYTQSPGYISLGQTNFGDSGGGTTDCTILDTTLYACGDEVITLTSQFPDALAYVWYEYNPATEQYDIIQGEDTSTLEVTEDGTYKLVSYDTSGVPSEEVFTVEYSPEPEVDLGDTVSLCDVGQATLDATPTNPGDFGTPIEYVWYQDGTEITGETNATLDVTVEGTYSVEVIGSILDEDGNPVGFTCIGTDSVEVTNSTFTVDLGGDQNFCSTDSYVIEATLTGAAPSDATFEWSDSDGVIVGET